MGWGFFKKIKEAFKKAGQWVKRKVIDPVVGGVKKIFRAEPVKAVVKMAPVIGAAIGGAKGNPQMGLQVGQAVQGIGTVLGSS